MNERDARVLQYIAHCVRSRGYPPSISEIIAHVGVASTSTGHDIVHRLVRNGLIEIDPKKSRTIAITATGMKALTEEV